VTHWSHLQVSKKFILNLFLTGSTSERKAKNLERPTGQVFPGPNIIKLLRSHFTRVHAGVCPWQAFPASPIFVGKVWSLPERFYTRVGSALASKH
jgi:hypothetical protein